MFAESIKVAAASNITYAMPEIIKEFNREYPDIKVDVIIGSSGKLTAQIQNYAPFDLFMSANMLYPNSLYKDGLAITKPIIYAKGLLALFSTRKNIKNSDINILIDRKIRKIAIANPKSAPYGQATVEALKNAKIYNKVTKKIIYGESISQTLSYSMMVVDIGIVAKSALYSTKIKRFKYNKHWIDIDRNLYTPIEQGIVILKKAKNYDDALKFYNFIIGDKAKTIFKSFGYI
jgi:molybdate transport system substrate-binding protein